LHPTFEAMGIGGHRYTGCSICGSIHCLGTTKWIENQRS